MKNIKILSEEAAKKELDKLFDILTDANISYYTKDDPVLTDAMYDKLKFRNIELEKLFPHLKHKNSPTDKVGANPSNKFNKVKHFSPMLSLNNAFNEKDIINFNKSIYKDLMLKEDQQVHYMAEPKIDGLSLSLTYSNRKLIKAATRGNGEVGEDVTENAKVISDIPLFIPDKNILEVRGEVYMSHKDFHKLNESKLNAGNKPFANPRNAAAGSLRLLDSEITRKRNLKFFAYSIARVEKSISGVNICFSQSSMLEYLKDCEFEVNDLNKICTNINQILRYHREMEDRRSTLDYDIDGVVYKVNRLKLQDILGQRSTTPRWAIAYKFSPEYAWTYIRNIDIQVGRTGALSPVARLEPITIGGVVVSNVTLHNEDYIAGKDVEGNKIRDGKSICIGDKVKIHRAGDVIPKISDIDIISRDIFITPYKFPTICPVCGSETMRENNDSVRRCMGGLKCLAQKIGRLKHFVSRDAFNIEGLGEKQIDMFYNDTLLPINTYVDIFTLKERDINNNIKLKDRDGWGETSAYNLFSSIEDKRNIPFNRLLYSFGIRHVGRYVSKKLALFYKEWDLMVSAIDNKQKDIMDIEGIGEKASLSLFQAFTDHKERKIIDDLCRVIKVIPYTENVSPNKTIVFTGTLQTSTRNEARIKAEALGYKVSNTISKNVDILVVGIKAGSKLKKAKDLNIKILNENEWIKLIS